MDVIYRHPALAILEMSDAAVENCKPAVQTAIHGQTAAQTLMAMELTGSVKIQVVTEMLQQEGFAMLQLQENVLRKQQQKLYVQTP